MNDEETEICITNEEWIINLKNTLKQGNMKNYDNLIYALDNLGKGKALVIGNSVWMLGTIEKLFNGQQVKSKEYLFRYSKNDFLKKGSVEGYASGLDSLMNSLEGNEMSIYEEIDKSRLTSQI